MNLGAEWLLEPLGGSLMESHRASIFTARSPGLELKLATATGGRGKWCSGVRGERRGWLAIGIWRFIAELIRGSMWQAWPVQQGVLFTASILKRQDRYHFSYYTSVFTPVIVPAPFKLFF